MQRLPILLLLLAAMGALPAGAPAQRDLVQGPIISVETDLVMLPVTVLDSRGAPVAGLAQSNFTVYDDGVVQPIEFFTSEDTPATIGLIIDSSSSMRAVRGAVTAAGAGFAEISHPLDELFTVNFNELVWPGLSPGVPFARSVDELRAALSSAPARGMTALYDAIDAALTHLNRGTHDRKVLVVVSDGGDNASSRSLEDVLSHARLTGAVIYGVAPFDVENHDARPKVLKTLAQATGGTTFTPDRPANVTKAFNQIAREVRSGYTIGFAPAETVSGGFRRVLVVARSGSGERLVVRTRAGYHARPSARSPD